MSCFRLHSRASVPTAPRKYLVVTMVEALTDQKSGNSTPRCSKTVSPVFQLVCTTSRRSHVISSYGCTPAVLKTRSILSPAPVAACDRAPAAPLTVSVIPCVPSLEVLYLIKAGGTDSRCRRWCARRMQLPHYTRRAVWVTRSRRVLG